MDNKIKVEIYNGMHQDNDPAFQPEGTYRESLNGDIVGNNSSDQYGWKTYNGNSLSFTIPEHYGLLKFQPIGWRSFDDVLVVLSCSEDSVNNGEIAIVTLNEDGTQASYLPIYFHTNLRFKKEHPVPHDGIVGKTENQNTKRIYWTDNYNSFRTINCKDYRLLTQIPNGSLVVGKQYMVLTTDAISYIVHDTVFYGPGRAAGNIFTATTANYSLVNTNAWVIEYVPIETLDVIPNITFGALDVTGYLMGAYLGAGNYQYFYRLKTKDGFKTNFSQITLPVHIVSNNYPDNANTIDYANNIAFATGTNTTKALKLKVTGIDIATYTVLEVGYMFSGSPGVYGPAKIFYSEEVIEEDVNLVHYGNETILEEFDLNGITIPGVSLDRVKSIAATKNILFASGLGVAEDPDFDLADVTVKCIEYLAPSDILGEIDASKSIPAKYAVFGHAGTRAPASYQTILPHQWYEVTQGTAIYNGVSYATGEFFKGVVNTTGFDSGSTGVVVPIIKIQKYSASTNTTSSNWKTIQLWNDYCDHNGLLVSHYLKSHWRQETYRYGIFLYGAKGQKNYTKWLVDKEIPAQWKVIGDNEIIDRNGTTSALAFDMALERYLSLDATCALKFIGLNFSNLDFDEIATAYGCAREDLDQYVKGFSIVRMERDSIIMSQGVLWPNMVDGDETHLCSTTDIATDKLYDAGALSKGRRPNSYMYYSPDILNGFGESRIIAPTDLIQITYKYDIIGSIGSGFNIGVAGYCQKYYVPTALTGTNITNGTQVNINIENTDLVDHGAQAVAFPLLVDGFFNDGTCASYLPILVGTIGAEKKAYGCDGVHLCPDIDESSPNEFGLGRHQAGDTHKCLVSIVRPKVNLYGGTSETTKATHKYIYCGHYQPLDAAFMAYMIGTADGTVADPSATKAAGIVNNVEVYGGDAFVSLFGFGRCYLDPSESPDAFSQGAVIPIESNCNPNWRGGVEAPQAKRTLNADRFYDLATGASNGISYANSDYEESWSLNAVYAGREYQNFTNARPLNFNGITVDENIIRFTLQKIDGEITDNWRVWLFENYKRNDSQFEGTTSIRAKGSKLFYWQKMGVGYMPVFERQLAGTEIGDAIQLGIGGVLERFDEIDYWYGLQHQFALMETENAFCWYDKKRKTILKMTFSGEKALLSTVKGFEDFIHNISILVTTDDNPLTGNGVFGYYDQTGKRGYMCFRISTVINDRIIETNTTLVFTELLDKYVSFMSFFPSHMINHNGHLLATREVLRTAKANTAYAVGDELNDIVTKENYICILAYTMGTLEQPSTNSTNWVLASAINQVFKNWDTSVIAQWFGKTYESYLTFVIKNNDGQEMLVEALKVLGNNIRFTDVITNIVDDPNAIEDGSGSTSAQDLNIKSYNRNYQYVDGAWHFNLPYERHRIVSSFLIVKLRIKNFVTHPAESVASLKIIRKIIALIRIKS